MAWRMQEGSHMKGHLRAPPGALCGQTVTPQPSARSPCPCTRGHPFVFSSTHPPRAPPLPTAPVAPAKTASSSPALARCVWSRPAAPPSRRGSHQSLRLSVLSTLSVSVLWSLGPVSVSWLGIALGATRRCLRCPPQPSPAWHECRVCLEALHARPYPCPQGGELCLH